MNSENITINGKEYRPVEIGGERAIVIWRHGWVFVGKLYCQGDDVHLTNASVIRRWGTERGLGQLAANGPTPDTKLDPCGDLSMQKSACIIMSAAGWAK
jgi:hypothetical protein